MKKLTFAIATSILFASSAAPAKVVVIGVDVSTSNPVISADVFAHAAAKYVREEILKMSLGDMVEIRSLGDRSISNIRSEKIQINRRNRADKVAASVGNYLEKLPTKTLEGQGSTNLLGFFETVNFDCVHNTKIILLTDGIEHSDYIDSKNFLAGKPLPKPETNFLSGCEVVMVGLGQSAEGELPPQAVKTIRTSWQTWFKAAGATFTPIINP